MNINTYKLTILITFISRIIIFWFQGFTCNHYSFLPQIPRNFHSLLEVIKRQFLHLGPFWIVCDEMLQRWGQVWPNLHALTVHLAGVTLLCLCEGIHVARFDFFKKYEDWL